MTYINISELAQIKTLDQGIVWAVISLHKANTHPLNTWYSDSASIRTEVAKNLVNWDVKQDETGAGKFTFGALMPILDPDPMVAQRDICEVVKSYSGFTLTDQNLDPPLFSKGFAMPTLPSYIQTMEQVLYYLCRIAAAFSHAIRSANTSIVNDPTYSFSIPIDTTTPVPFVDISSALMIVNTASTATDIIYQYMPPLELHQELAEAVSNLMLTTYTLAPSGIPADKEIDEGDGYREKGIETLPVCQEQDPSIVSLSDGDVINLLNKTA
jgi:hypothetical protein